MREFFENQKLKCKLKEYSKPVFPNRRAIQTSN